MREVLELVFQMAPYILLGFLLAGLMHAFIPNSMYRKYLGGNSFRTVVNAAILGVPLPLCSCGVIPTAMSLRREGASKGATVAFLISTPQTGVDSIIATYSLMGLPFALLRPVIAFVTAIGGGFIANRFGGEDGRGIENTEEASGKDRHKTGVWQKLTEALRYAFVDMMQDIGKWLVLGLVIAGIITVFVPRSFFDLFSDNSLLSMLIILLFTLPMYLCATGSIPIAMALMMKGLSPGTALVMLMAGPAINFASMLVIGKVMGRRTMLVYIGTVVCGAILFGLGIDHLLPREWFTDSLAHFHNHEHGTSYFNIGCTILLVALLINAFVRRHLHHDHCGCGHDHATTCSCGGECHSTADAPVVEVIIEGMMCNHCKANAERAIRAVSGVTDVDIDLVSGKTTVRGTAEKAQIQQAIEPLGFSLKTN